jgi:hypothetical protein
MRKIWLAAAAIAALTACEKRGEGADGTDTTAGLGNERTGVDTAVTSTTVQDTTIVRADTNIDVDTVRQTDNAADVRGGRDTTRRD